MRLLRWSLVAAAILMAIVIVRSMLTTRQSDSSSPAPTGTGGIAILDARADRDRAVEHLAAALRFRTISGASVSATVAQSTFDGFYRFIEESFPHVTKELRRERVGSRSALYVWEGSTPGLPPILLLAHVDVVPVEPASAGRWTSPPFGGVIRDGFLWGRGALDDKASALALLETAESLLERGFRPHRTLYFAFGGDEEVLGFNGARLIASLLGSRGVKPAFVLDEGSIVTQGMIPGLPQPLALIGVAEKGFLSLELIARADGGHSSAPPDQTAIGILGAGIERLEQHPFPTRPNPTARRMAEEVAGDMSFGPRLVFANVWLFRPVIDWFLMRKPITRASLRTTTAVTMISGGVQENVLPTDAHAIVNFRIMPGDTVESVTARVRKLVDDPRIEIERAPTPGNDPIPESSLDSFGYRTIARAVKRVIPGALVAPSLVIGATDSRHYRDLSADIYRFIPIRASPEDIVRIHGVDERIAVENYLEVIRFYHALITGADEAN
jgi:carboxypeptidase PM20D1